jgi:hypothetical protein
MKRIAVFSFRDILRWAMVPGVVALAAIGNPTIAQGEPINSCFGEVLDYAKASQMPGDLAVLQKQVFPVAGYASAQSLSDDRIPSAAVRQAVAKLTPIYQNCVEERHSEHLEMLEDVRKSHLAARVSLLHRLADGTLTYAEYARQLDMLRGQQAAGLFFWQIKT